jgi:hypothetical protein
MNPYTEALDKARQDLGDALCKRDECDRKVAALQTTIDVLSSLLESFEQSIGQPQPEITVPDGAGISDAIRLVFKQSSGNLTAPLIRDRLSDAGFDITGYASILSVIHNTVKRMDDQGEILKITRSGRVIGWRYRR